MPTNPQTTTLSPGTAATHNLRLLSVTFSEAIAPEELECFRGAIAEKAGLENERYHNHNNTPGAKSAFHYRYPLIQYQLYRRQPRILFLDEAIEDAQHFFTQSDWNLNMNGRPYQTSIADLRASQCTVGVTPGQFHHYRLYRWQALNTDNFAQYQAIEPLRDKAAFLERILGGHLLAFFSGIGFHLPHRFQLDLTHLHQVRPGSYRGIKAQLFDVSFRAELLLPYGIGVGKGTGLGYGSVGKEREMDEFEKMKINE